MVAKSALDVGPEQVDAVLKFLPIFESEGFRCGEWVIRDDRLPSITYSPEVHGFVRTLYEQNIMFEFDWVRWKDEAKRYLADPGSLAEADLLTIRKLLTAHVRTDRFVEGHLERIFESGHMVQILWRLREIREGGAQSVKREP